MDGVPNASFIGMNDWKRQAEDAALPRKRGKMGEAGLWPRDPSALLRVLDEELAVPTVPQENCGIGNRAQSFQFLIQDCARAIGLFLSDKTFTRDMILVNAKNKYISQVIVVGRTLNMLELRCQLDRVIAKLLNMLGKELALHI